MRRMEDGSYDLRGATAETVGEALNDYFERTPREQNVFLMNKTENITERVREQLKNLGLLDFFLWLKGKHRGVIGKICGKIRDFFDDVITRF